MRELTARSGVLLFGKMWEVAMGSPTVKHTTSLEDPIAKPLHEMKAELEALAPGSKSTNN